MADVRESVQFKALVTKANAVLLTRGLEIEPIALVDVVAHMVDAIAEQTGLDPEEAVHLVPSDTVAEAIARASDEQAEGAGNVHARASRPR
ncbi:hypothetical protein [Allostreptomyces psammosilenae]|uniref:Uncharacterized protein n=1 Tax=Allostreptomyces psammosilenae TaxID=1892865 RepID=A0A853AAM8_9ACTN|nr:hypothetical protein [Allostreptomyces psammosilenae]NYI07568.1 hypothetical protein [Allostreptomyces psammosilenae]